MIAMIDMLQDANKHPVLHNEDAISIVRIPLQSAMSLPLYEANVSDIALAPLILFESGQAAFAVHADSEVVHPATIVEHKNKLAGSMRTLLQILVHSPGLMVKAAASACSEPTETLCRVLQVLAVHDSQHLLPTLLTLAPEVSLSMQAPRFVTVSIEWLITNMLQLAKLDPFAAWTSPIGLAVKSLLSDANGVSLLLAETCKDGYSYSVASEQEYEGSTSGKRPRAEAEDDEFMQAGNGCNPLLVERFSQLLVCMLTNPNEKSSSVATAVELCLRVLNAHFSVRMSAQSKQSSKRASSRTGDVSMFSPHKQVLDTTLRVLQHILPVYSDPENASVFLLHFNALRLAYEAVLELTQRLPTIITDPSVCVYVYRSSAWLRRLCPTLNRTEPPQLLLRGLQHYFKTCRCVILRAPSFA
jgi:hypothetical protein